VCLSEKAAVALGRFVGFHKKKVRRAVCCVRNSVISCVGHEKIFTIAILSPI
jgi:exonuclease VII large subunit